MANRPYLLATPTAAPALDGKALLAASNEIPIFWLSGFSMEDLVQAEVPMRTSNQTPTHEFIPWLIAPREQILSRSKQRITQLLPHLPSPLRIHADEWIQFLENRGEPFIQINTTEIWMLMSPGEFETCLKEIFHLLESSLKEDKMDLLSYARIFSQEGVEYDEDTTKFGLRGYAWSSDIPWKD
jgi:hypothetical protein